MSEVRKQAVRLSVETVKIVGGLQAEFMPTMARQSAAGRAYCGAAAQKAVDGKLRHRVV
jgi:hypothetical protein